MFVHNNIKYINAYTTQSRNVALNFDPKSRVIERGEEYQYQLLLLHIKKLSFENYYDANFMQFSYALCIFILATLLIGAGVFLYKDKMYFRNEICSILVISVFAALAFQLLYTIVFSKRDALLLVSEERCMGSFLVDVTVFPLYREHIIINWKYFYYMGLVTLCPTPSIDMNLSYYSILDDISDTAEFQIGVSE